MGFLNKNDKKQLAAKAVAEEKDLQERMNNCNKELPELLKKFDLALAAQPVITPDGRIGSTPIYVSTRGLKKQPLELSNPEK